MKYRRGDVVLLDYPFADASGTKVRPALVVQADARNAILSQTIVAMITRNLSRVGVDPTQLYIDLGTPDGQQSGLRANSAVVCGNLFTVDEQRILKAVGSLPAALLLQVNARLKVALDLP